MWKNPHPLVRASHITITKHFSQDYLQSNKIMPVLRNYKFRLYPIVQQEKRLQNNSMKSVLNQRLRSLSKITHWYGNKLKV